MSDDEPPGLGPHSGVPSIARPADWSRVLLDEARGFVLSHIDGRTTLHQILLLAPYPQTKTVALLLDLFARGLIDIPGVPRPPPSPGSGGTPGGNGGTPAFPS